MSHLIELILAIAALLLLIPSTVLLGECLAAFWLRPGEPEVAQRPTVAVLVPAHNEAAGITQTIKTLHPQLTAQDRLIVIADNCTDNTADLARQLGVIVIERHEPDRQKRGKGYALDYGLNYLQAEPPEVVVTVDADCTVASQTVERIARLAKATNRPVQSVYLMQQPDEPSVKDTISALAVLVKNLVRPSGLTVMGFPCLLMGSGMAFPWPVMSKVSLANSKTVDDMQLGLDLAIAGYPPLFCREGFVEGRLMAQQFAKSQRSRWEHGHLETLLGQTPRLLKEALVQKRWALWALALELSVPPLSLLVILWLAVTGGTAVAVYWGLSWLPLLISAIAGVLISVSILGAWAKFGRDLIPGRTLLAIPLYVLWKIPLYLAFWIKPQTKWLQTEREEAQEI
ncbi:MAG: glycosyltransferase family 2 protein [Cyanophyceae cyanobacterium]